MCCNWYFNRINRNISAFISFFIYFISFPKEKIGEINKALEDLLGKQKFYENLVANGDNSFKDKDYAKTWDFKLQSSQQLKLVVKVSSFNKPGDTPASGCVAIMFGFKMKK